VGVARELIGRHQVRRGDRCGCDQRRENPDSDEQTGDEQADDGEPLLKEPPQRAAGVRHGPRRHACKFQGL
jgi:hypothetical protein